ncbi:LamG-like jellyroll fold domain-containing protein [Spirosoma arcticum]
MKKTILSYLLSVPLLCLGGQLLLGCEAWELPARKTQRDCVPPAGNLDASAQQKQVNFSISNASGTVDEVLWDFGNGSTTITTGLTATYTYPTSNTYTVQATLSNTCKVKTTLLRTIGVSDATLPTVSLQAITIVSTTSATAGMAITSTGNATITRYGICYSPTSPTPEEDKDPKEERTGAVAANTPLSFLLKDLQPNTFYYARSYAVNSTGPNYSSPVQTFRTGQNPAVTTNGTPNVGITTATVNFIATSPGYPAAVSYGICYSSTTNAPDVNSPTVDVPNPTIAANTVVNLTNLAPNTTYYYRPYAKSPSGEITYGAVATFKTLIDTIIQDLIASVSFTDGSVTDVSGLNNHVILVNNPIFTTDHRGQPNSAILLNGSGNYFYMADNSSLRPEALSISIWIRPNAINNVNDRMQVYNKSRWDDSAFEMYSSMIKKNPDGGPGLIFLTDIKQNSQCQSGKQWQSFQFGSNPLLNAWHHLVFSYSGQSVRMYFDNVLVDQRDDLPASTIDECPGGELKFGAQIKDLPNYFSGAMDDIRMYKRALTAAEVQTLYNQ